MEEGESTAVPSLASSPEASSETHAYAPPRLDFAARCASWSRSLGEPRLFEAPVASVALALHANRSFNTCVAGSLLGVRLSCIATDAEGCNGCNGAS